jgi:nucleotide-binding universal stress UspA family protein
MFKKILYPTDFSDPSKKALDYVKQLKESGAEEVIVLHVIEDREIPVFLGLDEGDPVPGTQLEKTLRIIEENAKEETGAIAAELKESGFDVKVRIEKGTAFRERRSQLLLSGPMAKVLLREYFSAQSLIRS